MLLYLIRHGDPDYALDCLTERGRLQAETVGKRLADSRIDRIFSSPMGRARETAEPACRLLGLNCTVEDWTYEIPEEESGTKMPDGTYRKSGWATVTYFRENGDYKLGYDDALKGNVYRDSRMQVALDRIENGGKAFLERLGYRENDGVYKILRPNEERVALFCHGGFMATWVSVLLHMPLHLFMCGTMVTHTGVTVLDFKNFDHGITVPRLLCYSDMSHLYRYGPDMMFCNGQSL